MKLTKKYAQSKVWPGSWEGKRNRVRCLHCDDVIEATHQHDFKSCRCKAVSIDGGALGHWRRLFPENPGSEHFVEMP